MDYILNGQSHGNVASMLMNNNFDVGLLRPFIGKDGRHYVTRNKEDGKTEALLTNANATLRKDEWIYMDEQILKAARNRLRLVADLRSSGLSLNIPNGMSKTILEYQRMSDVSDATVSMDGVRAGERSRPIFDLQGLPLPIIHKDFSFSARQIAASRNGGSPLDMTMGEQAGRKVAEEAEKLVAGTSTSFSTYGGYTIYGYTNFTSRMTKVMTLPTGVAWTPTTTVREVIAMRQQCYAALHYGPFRLYTSPSWDAYLDEDYSAAKGDNTLRDRLLKIRGIQSVETSDYLNDYQMVLVQQSSDVVREVVGMDIVTLQWETDGGMMVNFKVMCIMVPQLRADINGKTGIVHGTAA